MNTLSFLLFMKINWWSIRRERERRSNSIPSLAISYLNLFRIKHQVQAGIRQAHPWAIFFFLRIEWSNHQPNREKERKNANINNTRKSGHQMSIASHNYMRGLSISRLVYEPACPGRSRDTILKIYLPFIIHIIIIRF